MIVFTLRCESAHEFEGWFRDGAAFERQAAAQEVACPHCGSHHVEKAPMAPRVRKSSEKATPSPAQLRAALVALRQHVEQHCENVGERFAEEARRIHYGETEPHGIYGDSSDAEAEALAEEGIAVARLPWIQNTDA
jgi:hypothetical protein